MEQVMLRLLPAMDLIPSKLPQRRVITSIVPDLPPADSVESEDDSPFALKGSRVFSGNGRAMFMGILAGAVLISAIGFGYARHERAKRAAMTAPRLFTVATHKSLTTQPGNSTPAPVVVQVSDLIHVSAIALGHPRLAVINGRAVAEGDWVTVHGPNRAIAVTLRVLKIADGRVDLTDGTQTISAQLEIAKPIRREQN
jgi:hypothetical protein